MVANGQEISTEGYPIEEEDGTDKRATLVVNGPVSDGKGHTTAIEGTFFIYLLFFCSSIFGTLVSVNCDTADGLSFHSSSSSLLAQCNDCSDIKIRHLRVRVLGFLTHSLYMIADSELRTRSLSRFGSLLITLMFDLFVSG